MVSRSNIGAQAYFTRKKNLRYCPLILPTTLWSLGAPARLEC